jgi:FSR family fosmidomycin resistance protein-like MFS transporter
VKNGLERETVTDVDLEATTGVGRALPYPSLIVLSLGHSLVDLYGGALLMLLPVLQSQFGLSYAAVGVVAMLFNLTSSMLQPLFGVVSDRVNCLWLMPLGCILAAGMALVGYSGDVRWILACVLLCGIGSAAYHPEGAKQTYLIGGSRKSTAQAIYTVGGNLGYAIGPASATLLLALAGMKGMIWLVAPALLTTVLIVTRLPLITRLGRYGAGGFLPSRRGAAPAGSSGVACSGCDQEGDRSRREPVGKGAATDHPPWGVIVVLVLIVTVRSLIYMGVTTFVPMYYINYLKDGNIYAGFILTSFLMAGVLGSAVAGPLADRFGNKAMLALSFVLCMPPLWLQLYTSGTVSILMAALSGFALISSMGITVVLAQQVVPNNVGLASGLMIGLGSGFAALVTPLYGALADAWGLPLVLKLNSILPVLALLLIIALPRLLPAGLETGKVKFEPASSSPAR